MTITTYKALEVITIVVWVIAALIIIAWIIGGIISKIERYLEKKEYYLLVEKNIQKNTREEHYK